MKRVCVFHGRNRLIRLGLAMVAETMEEELNGLNEFQDTERWQDLRDGIKRIGDLIMVMDVSLLSEDECVELPESYLEGVGFALEYVRSKPFECIPPDVREAMEGVWRMASEEIMVE